MAVNKVIYDGEPLIDLTEDTVTADTLLEGMTAHGANGAALTGKMKNYAVDDTPTKNSENLVKSGGVYSAIPNLQSGTDVNFMIGLVGTGGQVNYQPYINKEKLLDYIYPVGAVYMSVDSTSPASFLGGTWARIQDTFLLAAGSSYAAGVTGGEAAHTLTGDEIPGHVHSIVAYDENGEDYSDSDAYLSFNFNTAMKGWPGHTGFTGGRVAHNNMPPYLAVYVWKRTK